MDGDDIIINILAEKAYTIFWEKLNSNLEYFERENPEPFDMTSKNTQEAWRATVLEIIKSYPTMDNLETEEGE